MSGYTNLNPQQGLPAGMYGRPPPATSSPNPNLNPSLFPLPGSGTGSPMPANLAPQHIQQLTDFHRVQQQQPRPASPQLPQQAQPRPTMQLQPQQIQQAMGRLAAMQQQGITPSPAQARAFQQILQQQAQQAQRAQNSPRPPQQRPMQSLPAGFTLQQPPGQRIASQQQMPGGMASRPMTPQRPVTPQGIAPGMAFQPSAIQSTPTPQQQYSQQGTPTLPFTAHQPSHSSITAPLARTTVGPSGVSGGPTPTRRPSLTLSQLPQPLVASATPSPPQPPKPSLPAPSSTQPSTATSSPGSTSTPQAAQPKKKSGGGKKDKGKQNEQAQPVYFQGVQEVDRREKTPDVPKPAPTRPEASGQSGAAMGGTRERERDRGTMHVRVVEPQTAERRKGPAEGMRGSMRGELAKLMYACGDVPDPNQEAIDCLEDMVVEFIADLCRPAPPLRPATNSTHLLHPLTADLIRHRLVVTASFRKYLARFDAMSAMSAELAASRRLVNAAESHFDLAEMVGRDYLGIDEEAGDAAATAAAQGGGTAAGGAGTAKRKGRPPKAEKGERRKPGPAKGWKRVKREGTGTEDGAVRGGYKRRGGAGGVRGTASPAPGAV